MKVSYVGMIIPNTWKNNKCSKPPSSYGSQRGMSECQLIKEQMGTCAEDVFQRIAASEK